MTLSLSSPIELTSVPFFGCTLAEYSRFFSLDVASLRRCSVLDVAAGPSSFTVEAFRRGIDAVAVDPLYGCPVESLAAYVQIDHAHLRAYLDASSKRHGPRLEEIETNRRLAAQRFLADYETGFLHNRYLGAALPRLPFFDGTFDLVLCAHLLFLSAGSSDLIWHIAACRELVRVSTGEARIYPLCSRDGRPYPELRRLQRELRAEGVACEVVALEGEFPVGGNAMLVLRKRK